MAINHLAIITVMVVKFLARFFDAAGEARILWTRVAHDERRHVPSLLIREGIAGTVWHIGLDESSRGADAFHAGAPIE